MRSLSDSSVTTRDEFEFGIVGFVVFGFCGFVVFGSDMISFFEVGPHRVGEPQKTQPQMLAYRANFRSSGILSQVYSHKSQSVQGYLFVFREDH